MEINHSGRELRRRTRRKKMIKKIDVRKLEPKEEEEKQVYTEYLDNDGAWEKPIPFPKRLSVWKNYVEVDMFDRYEHRYFWVWDNDGDKPTLCRVKK
jgi:hypothetical protein